jgi:hypothetical protein
MMDGMREKIAAAIMGLNPWAGLGGAAMTGTPPVGDPGDVPGTTSVPKGLTFPSFSPNDLMGGAFKGIGGDETFSPAAAMKPPQDDFLRYQEQMRERQQTGPRIEVNNSMPSYGASGGMGFNNRRRRGWEIGLGGPQAGRAPLMRF